MNEDDLPDSVPTHVVDQLLDKSWDELEVLEHAGYLLFPDKLYKRRKDGKFDEMQILLRVPREPELRKARVMARQMAEQNGLDAKLDRDLIANHENFCVLWMAIRNPGKSDDPNDPHEPLFVDAEEMERTQDKAALLQLYDKLDKLMQLIDPAPADISKNEMIALMGAIAKARNLGPLAVYGSAAQTSFVLTMVDMLLTSMASKSSLERSEPSTPAP